MPSIRLTLDPTRDIEAPVTLREDGTLDPREAIEAAIALLNVAIARGWLGGTMLGQCVRIHFEDDPRSLHARRHDDIPWMDGGE